MTMNLSGSLEAFGLDEVLSLLGMGGRTARMQVSSGHGTGWVHLVDGHVSAASADPARAGLLRALVAACAVPADDLAAALGQDEPVVALVDGGVVGRDVAHRVAVEHIVDALGEMLAWPEGQFAVWAGEADRADIGVRLPVAEAVDRGRARVQEWARVHEALPEPDSVLVLAPEPGEPPVLALEDWAVLARVDGRRTLAEVLAAVGIAPLVASERVVQLMGRGLVGVRAEVAAQPDEVAALIDAFEGRGPRSEPAEPVTVRDDGPEDGLVMAAGADGAAEVPVVGRDEARPQEVAPAVEPVGTPEPVPVLLVEEPPAGAEVPAPVAVEVVEVEAAVEPVAVEAEVEAAVEVVPVLIEDPAPMPAAPWEAAGAALELTDPAVAAWLESATPADELVALVGQLPVDAALPAQTPVVPAVDPVFSFPVEVEPVAWAPAAEPATLAPAAPEPVVAPAVEWSPWAQALGLGAPAPEGELVVDPLAGPGIAEMIADAHGLSDTSDVPVPLMPVVPEAFIEQPVVPGPREPEGQSWTVGAAEHPAEHAAEHPADAEADPDPQVPAPSEHVPDVAPPVATAADPLTGGLLSQLMSGVRGL